MSARSSGDTAAFDIKIFTDNVVVGYPIRDGRGVGEPELGHIFGVFADFQAMLAMQGHLVRGGIALGNHYMDDDIVFGDALIEAVKLDESGGAPRIALAPSAVEAVQHHLAFYGKPQSSPDYDDLLQDADGTVFLNYLEVAFVGFPDGGINLAVFEKHRNRIEGGLERFQGKQVRPKYEWAARYHNFVCEDFADRYASVVPSDAETAALADHVQSLRDFIIKGVDMTNVPTRLRLNPIKPV
ncbi:hypothetical protein ACFL6C_04930 [Myxococcota bacterium]